MVRAISAGWNLEQAYARYKAWCRENNLPYRQNECIALSATMPVSRQKEKIKGYFNPVVKGEIALIGMTKDYFMVLYLA